MMVVNMNMRGNEKGNINQYLADTISNMFSEVYTVDVADSTNRELFASNNPEMLKVFSENIDTEDNVELFSMMNKVSSSLTVYEAGEYLMTDDKAPVELLGIQVIDEVVSGEVEYYRDIFENEGIQGLLDQLS